MDWVLIQQQQELSLFIPFERLEARSGMAAGGGVARSSFENRLKQIGDPRAGIGHLVEIVGHRSCRLGREGGFDRLLQLSCVFSFDQSIDVRLPAYDYVILEVERNIDTSKYNAAAQARPLQSLVNCFIDGVKIDTCKLAGRFQKSIAYDARSCPIRSRCKDGLAFTVKLQPGVSQTDVACP